MKAVLFLMLRTKMILRSNGKALIPVMDTEQAVQSEVLER